MEPNALEFFPDHLKTHEVCKKVVHIKLYTLEYVPDHLNKTKDICYEVMHIILAPFFLLPGHFKALEMCN